jgi:Protein of unknown function (DUF1449)
MDLFLTPPFNIYTIAAGFVLGLSLLEILMFVLGLSMSKLFHHDADLDHDHHWGDHDVDLESVNIFNFGKVPFFLILVCLAGFFGFSGIGIHLLLKSFGVSLSNLFVLPLSILSSSILTYVATSAWAKVFPNEETYAISEKEYIGSTGVVQLGTGDNQNAVEIATYDKHGNKHFIMAHVALPKIKIFEGQKVKIVAREKNKHFLVLPVVEKLQTQPFERDIEM